MNVSQLIKSLEAMPKDAEVVSAKDPEGAWAVLSKPTLHKYRNIKICILKDGY